MCDFASSALVPKAVAGKQVDVVTVKALLKPCDSGDKLAGSWESQYRFCIG